MDIRDETHMKYLLLGGAGFIGKHLSDRLISDGHQVTVVDTLITSTAEGLHPAVDFIKADVSSSGVDHLIQRHDVVYFLAGSVGVLNVISDPQATFNNNMRMASCLIPALQKYNKRVIFSSTSEVYGDGPFVESGSLTIGPPTELRWSYAAAKLATEFMIMAAHIPSTIVRFFNVVGPGQASQYGMVLPRFVQAAKVGKPLQVYGNGEQMRSFCHVKDAVNMLRQLEEAPVGIYNVGSYNPTSVLNLANRVIELSGSSSVVEFCPQPCSDISARIPDLTKLHDTIGNLTTYTLDDIVKSML